MGPRIRLETMSTPAPGTVPPSGAARPIFLIAIPFVVRHDCAKTQQDTTSIWVVTDQ